MATIISIIEAFECIDDHRIERCKKHKLIDIIVISVCALICRAEGWEDIELFGNERIDWLKTFLELPNDIPSHDTFRRVFERIDPTQFQQCLMLWTKHLHDEFSGKIVAIDGKTIKRSFDNATGKNALHLVSAWVQESNIMHGQCSVGKNQTKLPMCQTCLICLKSAVLL